MIISEDVSYEDAKQLRIHDILSSLKDERGYYGIQWYSILPGPNMAVPGGYRKNQLLFRADKLAEYDETAWAGNRHYLAMSLSQREKFGYRPHPASCPHSLEDELYVSYSLWRWNAQYLKYHSIPEIMLAAISRQKTIMGIVLHHSPKGAAAVARKFPDPWRQHVFALCCRYGKRMVQMAETSPYIVYMTASMMGAITESRHHAALYERAGFREERAIRTHRQDTLIRKVLEITTMIEQGAELREILAIEPIEEPLSLQGYPWERMDMQRRRHLCRITPPMRMIHRLHHDTSMAPPNYPRWGVEGLEAACYYWCNMEETLLRLYQERRGVPLTRQMVCEWLRQVVRYMVGINMKPPIQPRYRYAQAHNGNYEQVPVMHTSPNSTEWRYFMDNIMDWVVASLRPEYHNQRWSINMSPRRAINHSHRWHENPEHIEQERAIQQRERPRYVPATHDYHREPEPEMDQLLVVPELATRLAEAGQLMSGDWEAIPLLTRTEFHEEGRTQSNCVAGYWYYLKDLTQTIWSIRREGKHIATLQVDNKWASRQLREFRNGAPHADTTKVVNDWLKQVSSLGIVLSGYPKIVVEEPKKEEAIEVVEEAEEEAIA